DAVGLTENDFKHEVVKKRLNAKKRLRIQGLDEGATLEDALANRAWTLADSGKKAVRVIIYSNSPVVAQRAKDTVEKLAKGDKKAGTPTVEICTELFVGGRRVFERAQAKKRLEALGFIAGSTVARTRPVFLFATSAGEVGVDLDADHMVCDLVPWERMVQRLGRVNRRGEGDTSVAVLVEPKPKASKKEQEAVEKQTRNEELDDTERKRVEDYEKKVREWENQEKPIKCLRRNDDGSFDASPAALLHLKSSAATDTTLQR